ncbi:MAG: hypothetical protein ACLGHV_10595 [Gammaproteobacteria bacterium]
MTTAMRRQRLRSTPAKRLPSLVKPRSPMACPWLHGAGDRAFSSG